MNRLTARIILALIGIALIAWSFTTRITLDNAIPLGGKHPLVGVFILNGLAVAVIIVAVLSFIVYLISVALEDDNS